MTAGLRQTGRTADGRFQVYNQDARKLEYRDSWDDLSPEEQAWFLNKHPRFRPDGEPAPEVEQSPDFEEPEHVAELRAFIAYYREEIANMEAERRRTTDQTMRLQLLARIGDLRSLVRWHEMAIKTDPAPQKYGHDKSERFTVPIPGRDPITFYGHMYTANDIVEKTVLESLVGKEPALRRIADDQRPFWHIETNDFYGWDSLKAMKARGANIAQYRAF